MRNDESDERTNTDFVDVDQGIWGTAIEPSFEHNQELDSLTNAIMGFM